MFGRAIGIMTDLRAYLMFILRHFPLKFRQLERKSIILSDVSVKVGVNMCTASGLSMRAGSVRLHTMLSDLLVNKTFNEPRKRELD